MKTRPLRESDHREILLVVDEWWGGRRVSEKLPRLFFRHFADTSYAVEDDGSMVAFLVGLIGSSGREAYIHFVGVHPDHRGRGIGRQLYETFLVEARRRGCQTVRCITSPVNKYSIAFHKSLGFGIEAGDGEIDGVSVHENYDGDGKPKDVFWKVLES